MKLSTYEITTYEMKSLLHMKLSTYEITTYEIIIFSFFVRLDFFRLVLKKRVAKRKTKSINKSHK